MVKVRVPATSANLGPGFDSLGIAFNIYNEYEFSFEEHGVTFEGVEPEFQNEDNIILIAMKKVFSKFNFNYNGLKIKILQQQIPVSRGLGSSSSCIVAGLIGAYLLMGKEIEREEVFKLAVEIEGHPDNVCPAIFGGLVATVMEGEEAFYNKVDVKDGVKFIALIPRFTLSTKKAREVLPKELSYKDSIYNIGRAALLISCFANGNYDLLKVATKDKLHEIYRSKLIDSYDLIYNMAKKLGALGCIISGAGPTLMAIISNENTSFKDEIGEYIKGNNLEWDILELVIDNQGAKVLKGDN